MAEHRYVVNVLVGTGGGNSHEIYSPSFGTEEEAQAALKAISTAQTTGNIPALDWLSVKGGNIIAASIQRIT